MAYDSHAFDDGSVILLAVEEWLTPDGHLIWQEGLPPAVMVSLPEDAERLVRPGREDVTEESLRLTEDIQFLRGLALLREQLWQSTNMTGVRYEARYVE